MIHRAEHKGMFLRINYAAVRDNRLSFGARGFLALLLTMSDSWDFSIKGLMSVTGLNKKAVMRYVKELKDAGYITQERQQDGLGHFGAYVWHIYEQPTEPPDNGTSAPKYPKTEVRENGSSVNPKSRKRVPIRTNNIKELTNSKNEQISKNEKSIKKADRSAVITSVVDWLEIRDQEEHP